MRGATLGIEGWRSGCCSDLASARVSNDNPYSDIRFERSVPSATRDGNSQAKTRPAKWVFGFFLAAFVGCVNHLHRQQRHQNSSRPISVTAEPPAQSARSERLSTEKARRPIRDAGAKPSRSGRSKPEGSVGSTKQPESQTDPGAPSAKGSTE